MRRLEEIGKKVAESTDETARGDVFDLPRRLTAEALGTAFLVGTVVGSGIMADRLTSDEALALLGSTLPTGAILVVLIATLGPISGAHFNPAVTIARGFSDTFSGIRSADVPAFVAAPKPWARCSRSPCWAGCAKRSAARSGSRRSRTSERRS